MARRPPAFQFYASDWNASKAILLMKPIQHGYYINLLARAWDSDQPGTLPNDPDLLWRLARADNRAAFEKDSALVLAQFKRTPRGNRLYHPRLRAERIKQLRFSTNQASKGAIGGKAKAAKVLKASSGLAVATPDASRNLALQSSVFSLQSSSSSQKHKDNSAAVAAVASTDWIPLDAWGAYVAMRVKIKRPLTERAVDLAISKLSKLRGEGHDPRAVLDQSVFNSWQGLFPVGENSNGSTRGSPKHYPGPRERIEERQRITADAIARVESAYRKVAVRDRGTLPPAHK